MRSLTVFLIVVLLFISCKKEKNEQLNKQKLNDKVLLDSIKKAYKDHYSKLYEPPNDSIAKIRKPPYTYVKYIGLEDFCFDKERLQVHKTLFSKGDFDKRFRGFVMYGKSVEKASDSTINNFTIKQSLVYALVYPEFSSQTCGVYYDYDDFNEIIVPYFKTGPEGFHASERQKGLLKRGPDSVSYYLNQCYKTKEKIPITVHNIIKDLNLYECIPVLIESYNKRPNNLILTTFISLMFKDKYEPFFYTNTYKEMKKGDKFNRGKIWNLTGVDATEEKINEVITSAQNYYQWKLQKQS